LAMSCATILSNGGNTSGVYTIDPDGREAFQIFCDQDTLGGGWTVFQRRQDGSVDFYRNWTEYKHGFGGLEGEFWLGLDRIHRLTNAIAFELRVGMEAEVGETAHAQYGHFTVAAETDKYRLECHDSSPFSTKDQDNDSFPSSCAVRYKGAWWYLYCHQSNLNGFYYNGSCPIGEGVIWLAWKGYYYSLKRTEMKIRPKGFTP
ncbi:predicted protein, partial [Nematostella vectensis]